jgi:3-hydroxyacyl-[acyl-carrier-protein] dehydratase
MITLGPLVALDRVVGVEPGHRATALRNVPHTLDIFDSHFPRRPVLPGVLVLGSIAELAGVVLTARPGAVWKLTRADRIRYRHFIEPGDQMEIEVEVKDLNEPQATLKAVVRVDERVVTSVGTLVMTLTQVASQDSAAAGRPS